MQSCFLKLKAFYQKYPNMFWLNLFLTGVCLLGFEEIVDDVFYDPLEGDLESEIFDRKVSTFIMSMRSSKVTQLMTDITALGSYSVIACLTIAVLIVGFRRKKELVYLITLLTGAVMGGIFLKLLFARERPNIVDHLVSVSDFSFPSGHALGATSAYLGFAFLIIHHLISWERKIVFIFLTTFIIISIGTSRIYLGVHYPSDVLAGTFLGGAWFFFLSALYKKNSSVRVKKSKNFL